MGDLIGPYLYAKMNNGQEPLQQTPATTPKTNRVYLTCGSILQPQIVQNNTEIWGSGIIERNVMFRNKPAIVHAVRGPLSRNALIRSKINCPEIYGDPGLLLPRFYKPKTSNLRYRIGIIPHYVDNDFMKFSFSNIPGVLVIDMDRPVEAVCDDIASCDATISSSLHGIVVSHAYGIPSAWMTTKTKLWGDNVKYRDYYASVGVLLVKPIDYKNLPKTADQLTEMVKKYLQPVKIPDLDALLAVCPFKAP